MARAGHRPRGFARKASITALKATRAQKDAEAAAAAAPTAPVAGEPDPGMVLPKKVPSPPQ